MSADTPGDNAGSAPGAQNSQPDAERLLEEIDRPVLLFDGVCNLCNGVVRFVVRFDAEAEFLFAPLQSDVGQALLERHGLPTDDFDSFVLVENGEYATKSTAALRVVRRLDGPWPLAAPLISLPESLRNRVYDLVADYRYRLFGKKDECPVPEPEIRERFATRTLE